MTRRRFVAHPLVVRRLTVLAVRDVTPRMRRVTLGGPELGAFTRDGADLPAFVSTGFDDHVKIVLTDGTAPLDAVLPRQLPHGIEWTPHPARIDRDYTPRRVTATELDLDLVLHSDGPSATGAGPAERWALAARPGSELAVVGPKSSTVLPDDADHVVLVADETGLPAVGRFLDERPLPAPVTAVVTVADRTARQDLALREVDRVLWVEAEPGDPEALATALQRVDDAVWAGRPFVWGGAESRALLPVRRHLTRERGLARDRLDVTGYWHRRSPAAPDPTAGGTSVAAGAAGAGTALAEAAPPEAPVAWLALRSALQLGVLDALDEPGRDGLDAASVAAAVDVDRGVVAAVLDVLAEAGLVTATGPAGTDAPLYRLTETTRRLLADDHERDELVGPSADAVLALGELAAAARAGRSAWEQRHGATLAAAAAADPVLADELSHDAEQLAYLTPGLLALPLWEGARTVVSGPGAAVVRPALEAAGVGCVDIESADHADHADHADVVVEAATLAVLTDAEAEALLTARADAAPVLVLVEQVRDDALGRGHHAEALLQVARTGRPRRSDRELARAARHAGWQVASTHDLGWGVEALVLRRGPHGSGW